MDAEMFRCHRNLLRACYTLFCCASVSAIESPSFTVTTLDTKTVYTATPASSNLPNFKPHVNFPYMKIRADGGLEADASVGQTQSGAQFGVRAYSNDNGQTWTTTTSYPSVPNVSIVRSAGTFSYGFSYAASGSSITSFNGSKYSSTNGGTSWSAVNCTFNTGTVAYSSLYNNYGDVVQSGSQLLITAYGPRAGSSTQESVLFASSDNGSTWTRRSTIASYTSDVLIGMGSEGPSECGLVKLNNGNLLAVFRTGQPFPSSDLNAVAPPIMWAMSSDNGVSWTTPKSLGVSGVFPTIRKLDDGSVALTYGRYGVKVMFADETGLRWSRPTTVYAGPGSGHTEIRKMLNGQYAMVYDQSSFFPPSYNASPPAAYTYNNQQSANLKMALLNITRNAVTDDYAWQLEYHGDVAPDSLGVGWVRTSSGPSLFEYYTAEAGQDYTRLDTGLSSTAKTLYYTLSGAGLTPWTNVDFAGKGLVLDVRAKANYYSEEGSADISIGDASSGSVFLQFVKDNLVLEGVGGDAQQAVYSSAAHPGFLASQWHDYRLVISPDPANTSQVLARVYLDGNYASPVLSKLVSASIINKLQYGDSNSLYNGGVSVDYLRFTSLLDKWGLIDPNLDGKCNSVDFNILAGHFGAVNPRWVDGDFNFDHAIDSVDFGLLLADYGKTKGSPLLGAIVPEPASLVLLLPICFLRRRT
jgi:hypothetical protein